MSVSARLLWVGIVFSVMTLVGCDALRDPPPPPLVLVEIRPGSRYSLDGVSMDRRQLEAQLKNKAEETTRSVKGGTRARVRLMLLPGADVAVREDLVEYCLSIGLDKLETPAVR